MPNIALPHYTTEDMKDWFDYFNSQYQYIRGDFDLRLRWSFN
jgi:hypothetical protein